MYQELLPALRFRKSRRQYWNDLSWKQAMPVWMDNRTNHYQIWSAPIDIDVIGIRQLGTVIPEGFHLNRIIPIRLIRLQKLDLKFL